MPACVCGEEERNDGEHIEATFEILVDELAKLLKCQSLACCSSILLYIIQKLRGLKRFSAKKMMDKMC